MEIKKVYDDYKSLIEKEITIKGWIRKHRKQKEISFIELSDGTCFKKLQVIYDKSIKDYDSITKIHFGSALKVTGILKLLQPFMPYVTDEIYNILPIKDAEDIMISEYPKYSKKYIFEDEEKVVDDQIAFIKNSSEKKPI